MWVAGTLLAFVAMMRVTLGALLLLLTFQAAGLRALLPFAAVMTGAAYLLWFARRGRHELRADVVPVPARKAVVGYGVVSLVVLPLADWLVLRTLG